MQRVFIAAYGTLQSKFGRWSELGMQGNCKVVGKVQVQGKLYQKRWFPMLIESDDPNDTVEAELIEVTSNQKEVVANLDHFEGHPNYFVRKLVNIEDKQVFVYYFGWDLEEDSVRIKEFTGNSVEKVFDDA